MYKSGRHWQARNVEDEISFRFLCPVFRERFVSSGVWKTMRFNAISFSSCSSRCCSFLVQTMLARTWIHVPLTDTLLRFPSSFSEFVDVAAFEYSLYITNRFRWNEIFHILSTYRIHCRRICVSLIISAMRVDRWTVVKILNGYRWKKWEKWKARFPSINKFHIYRVYSI